MRFRIDFLLFILFWVAVLALVGCPYSKNGRWRGDFDRADLIGMCRQLKACDIAEVYGAGAEDWDRCSLKCGCLWKSLDSLSEKKDGLYWTAPMCQPPGDPLLRSVR